MSSNSQRQFVELRDLSPSHTNYNTEYSRTQDHNDESEQTYIGREDSRSPIISSDEKPKISRRKAWKEAQDKQKVTKAGLIYRKVKNFSFITRWLLFIVPVGLLITVPIIVGAFYPAAEIAGVRIVWFFTWIQVLWLGLWVAKLVAKLLPTLFRFFISVVSVSTTKYATILENLEVPLLLFFWAIIALSTFSPIMTQNPTQRSLGETGIKPWESIVAKILTACVLSTAVLLAERFLIQLIAINFHKVQYELRITENKWAVNMFAKLLAHSRSMFPRFGQEFMEEDLALEPATFTGLHQRSGRGKGSRPGSGAVTPMQLVDGARRVFQVGAGLVEAARNEVSGKKQSSVATTYSIVVEALSYPERCAALTRRIWLSFVQEGNEALLPEDMLDVFGSDDQENAEAAFTYFDEDMNGDISLDEMQMKISEVARERKAIMASLKDTDSAIGRLNDALMFVVAIVVIFIFIALLDTSFRTLLATSATALLSLSFIFGTTCQEIMGSLIFVFVKHPFDISDRIVINSNQYIVQEMSLMFTILKRSDGTQVQAPNSLLNTLFIDNIRRSSAMTEAVTLSVDFDTPFEKIEQLQAEMTEFIKVNSRDFQSAFDITISEFSNIAKMSIVLVIKHKANWQNDALRAQRRNRWMCALALALKKLGIKAGGPALGESANPFIVQQITKSGDKDPFATPATKGIDIDKPPFDPTFGTTNRKEDPFDVDLRRDDDEPVTRLPPTITEERDGMIADEEARQTGIQRSGTMNSQLSMNLSRTRTGRRSNSQRSRVRNADLEANYQSERF